MKRFVTYSLCALLAAILFGGCRTTRYDFTKIQLNTTLRSSAGIAIAVQDLRPFVVSGEKPANYIGIHRDGVGIPKEGANTKSGKPLAEDLAAMLAANLSKKGLNTRQFVLSPGDDEQASIQKGASPPADRVLILRMEQFRSDSWAEVELNWKFRLDIYNENGTRLATSESEGLEEGLKRNYTGAISDGQAQKALSEKLIAIFEKLLSSSDCAKALQTGDWRYGKSISQESEKSNQPFEQPQTPSTQLHPPELANLSDNVKHGNFQAILEWAKDLTQKEESLSIEYLDHIASTIWEQRMQNDDVLIDALSYLCLTIGKSKNSRYRLVMEVVGNESQTRKLRKYAKKSLRSIPIDATVAQYQPPKKDILGQLPTNLESQLQNPPDGFIWQLYKNALFLIPEGWVRHEKSSYDNGFPIHVYAASPTEFSESNFFEMGITLQIVKDSKKEKNILAKTVALQLLKPFMDERKKGDVLMFSINTEGDFENIYWRYRDAPENLQPIIVHKFVMINNTLDSVHIFTFESPETTWESNWGKYGTQILKKVRLVATH